MGNQNQSHFTHQKPNGEKKVPDAVNLRDTTDTYADFHASEPFLPFQASGAWSETDFLPRAMSYVTFFSFSSLALYDYRQDACRAPSIWQS